MRGEHFWSKSSIRWNHPLKERLGITIANGVLFLVHNQHKSVKKLSFHIDYEKVHAIFKKQF